MKRKAVRLIERMKNGKLYPSYERIWENIIYPEKEEGGWQMQLRIIIFLPKFTIIQLILSSGLSSLDRDSSRSRLLPSHSNSRKYPRLFLLFTQRAKSTITFLDSRKAEKVNVRHLNNEKRQMFCEGVKRPYVMNPLRSAEVIIIQWCLTSALLSGPFHLASYILTY